MEMGRTCFLNERDDRRTQEATTWVQRDRKRNKGRQTKMAICGQEQPKTVTKGGSWGRPSPKNGLC